MINSMWSGVSGLRTHQTKLDVIGNDVANVNTVAYKQSNVTFQDAFYQTLSSAGEGTSGKQVGLGVAVAKITQDFNDGQLQETGVQSHLAITGDGFFVMKDAAGQNTSYTRAGDFNLHYNSTTDSLNLLGPDGKYLHGTAGATRGTGSDMIDLPSDIQRLAISSGGIVSYVDGTGALVEDAFVVDVATFAGQDALAKEASNQYTETPSSGAAIFTSTDYQMVQGHLENSNVDLAQEFTEMILTERGFQANSRTVTTSDSMLQELLNLKR